MQKKQDVPALLLRRVLTASQKNSHHGAVWAWRLWRALLACGLGLGTVGELGLAANAPTAGVSVSDVSGSGGSEGGVGLALSL